VILEAGADCNTRQEKSKTNPSKLFLGRIQEHEYYPVHYAADAKFNNSKTRSTPIEIIKLLLGKGADPFLQLREDATILHDIFQSGGIIQPFLELPNLDLEYRDPRGRTLFLAACLSEFGTNTPATFPPDNSNKTSEERAKEKSELTTGDPTRALTVYEKGGDLSALDNEDNNALHLLLLAKSHNPEEYKKTFDFFIQEAPKLVHQKNAGG
jgi:ankyrin repeat protein